MKIKRVHALTGIRGIAAIMVFLYHNRKFWRAGIPEFLMRLLNEFYTGVSIFFVLSGFLIAYTYQANPLHSKKDYLKYLLLRLARIFPVYLVILFIKFFYEGFHFNKDTLLTITLFNGFSNKFNLNGLPQAWSLCVELSFYTIAPIIYYFVKKSIGKTILLLFLLLLIVFGIGYGWHAINNNRDQFFYPWFFIFDSTFIGRFPEFLCGMLLARYLNNHKNINVIIKRKWNTIIGGIGILLVIFLLGLFEPTIYQHGTDNNFGLAIRNILFPCFVTLFFYGLIAEKTWVQQFLGTKAMVLLGNASFAFYLLHIGFANTKLRSIHLFPDRNFILLWLIAIAVYFLIEKPIYGLLRKLIRKW